MVEDLSSLPVGLVIVLLCPHLKDNLVARVHKIKVATLVEEPQDQVQHPWGVELRELQVALVQQLLLLLTLNPLRVVVE